MRESDFQGKLIKKIKKMFPGCVVMKNDPTYIQGIPDLIILYQDKWAALECKQSEKSSHQPNQDFYIDKMDDMSIAKFIFPENEEEVLNEIQSAFKPKRKTRNI